MLFSSGAPVKIRLYPASLSNPESSVYFSRGHLLVYQTEPGAIAITDFPFFAKLDSLFLKYSVFSFSGKSTDRKSTRLNSSHVRTSYAVFCLRKKKKNK